MSLALVTGGSGYFGAVLVRALHAQGTPVRVLDLIDSPDRPADVELVQCDIRDARAVHDALDGVDVVFNSVAQVPLARNRQLFRTVNRQGTHNLLEASRRVGVRKLVHLSSSAIFGVPKHNPVDEETIPMPGEAYGRAKLAAELLCLDYAERGFDVSIVRPRTIMGPGRLGIMQMLFEWVRQGRNIPVFGDGGNVYQFVHQDDLASACLLAAQHRGGDVFNIGAERFGTLRETLEGLIAHAGSESRLTSLPNSPAVLGMKLTSKLGLSPLGAYHWLMYGQSMYFDVSHAKSTLGWSAEHDNVQMFCEAYDWYVEHRDQVLSTSGQSHHRSPVRQGVLDLISRLL